MPQDRLPKKRYNISLKVILSVFEFSSEMLLRTSAVRGAESAPGLNICKVGLVYNTLLKLILELFNTPGGGGAHAYFAQTGRCGFHRKRYGFQPGFVSFNKVNNFTM